MRCDLGVTPNRNCCLFLSLPSPDRAVYELYTVYERTVHADHLFLFMRLREWNASLRCLDFILSLSPKNRVFLIAVLNCVVPGSLALSCSGLRLPTPKLTDHRCLPDRLLFMATDSFTSVKKL